MPCTRQRDFDLLSEHGSQNEYFKPRIKPQPSVFFLPQPEWRPHKALWEKGGGKKKSQTDIKLQQKELSSFNFPVVSQKRTRLTFILVFGLIVWLPVQTCNRLVGEEIEEKKNTWTSYFYSMMDVRSKSETQVKVHFGKTLNFGSVLVTQWKMLLV